MYTQTTLDRIAYAIVDRGTTSERETLERLAARVALDSPGAAAALVDWTAPEIVRLRAFGIVARALVKLRSTEASDDQRRVSPAA
ncbi:MAG TPA: hypothetical protein VMS74_04860 [Acidimicrobiia bacterium]|nr:hypothetical protein [Acidimicrobiia bacterium]